MSLNSDNILSWYSNKVQMTLLHHMASPTLVYLISSVLECGLTVAVIFFTYATVRRVWFVYAATH
jgi:hypothetical protein